MEPCSSAGVQVCCKRCRGCRTWTRGQFRSRSRCGSKYEGLGSMTSARAGHMGRSNCGVQYRRASPRARYRLGARRSTKQRVVTLSSEEQHHLCSECTIASEGSRSQLGSHMPGHRELCDLSTSEVYFPSPLLRLHCINQGSVNASCINPTAAMSSFSICLLATIWTQTGAP